MGDNTLEQLKKEAIGVTIQTTMAIAKILQKYIKEKQEDSSSPTLFYSFEEYINLEGDKYTVEKKVENKIEKLAENIRNKNTNIKKDQIKKQIKKQIVLKVEYLNTILKKYDALGLKDGKTKADDENETIKIPFSLQVENRMKKFINSEKMYEPQTKKQILEKQIKSVNNKITSAEILAKNLKKLNIRKKKDYSSFRGIPKDYNIVGVKNEVNEKIYEQLEQIQKSVPNQSKFGSNPQSEYDVYIDKIKSEVSDELIKLINQELGENFLGYIFKPKIDEQRVRELIRVIPNEVLQKKMTKKLEKKLKHTQPTSLGDLNRAINRDTKELTNNTNKIFDEVKKLVDRINKKDKRIIQLKNELEREKSISGTKLSNNKETFELNKKNLQDQLDARNRELENIENRYSNNHRKLAAQFSRIKLQDEAKQEELMKLLNETKSNNLKEIQNLRVTIQNNYEKQLRSIVKNLNNKNEQNLQLERNKFVEAEKKSEKNIKEQVAKALQTKREYAKYMKSKKIEYDKNIEKAKQNSSEAIKRLEDNYTKQISELKKEHKRFENRVSMVFSNKINEAKKEAGEKISKANEDYKINQGKDDKTKDAMRAEIVYYKKLLNDLNTEQTKALREGIDRRDQKIEQLKKDTQTRIKEQEEKLQRQQKQFKQNLQESHNLKLTQIKSAMDMNRESDRKKKEEEEAERKKKEEAEKKAKEEAERKKKEEAERKKKEEEERKKKEEAAVTTFEDFASKKNIDEEKKEKFKQFHKKRITEKIKSSNFGSSDFGDIEQTSLFNSKKELQESWTLFNIKQAGNFINKNSKKIAAVATAAGALIAGVKSGKKKSSSSKKKKKSKIKPFASKKAKALADKNNLSGKDFPEMEKVGVKDVREKINS